ncbi:MAG: stage II sporulation protein R [Bacillota bacterium]|nr:stage II sporulation protein R [Bacillota bacterium]
MRDKFVFRKSDFRSLNNRSNVNKHNIIKKRAILKITSCILSLIILLSLFICTSYSDNLNKDLSSNIIRLHVIANSDTPDDQALKRSVRDLILKYMRENSEVTTNLEETKKILTRDMDKITALARNEVIRWGKNYPVKTMLGDFPFPTKTYGDIALPAGNYQALRVVIGNGDGANWWCVLFPPLCFVDATHGTVPDDVKQKLKNSLSDEEYNIVTSSSSEDVPVKVKFKLIEVLQGSKIKLTSFVHKLFNNKK